MEIHISTSIKDIRLPVLPESFEVSDKQNNEVVTVQTTGEVNLIGKTGLRTVDITSIFPAQEYLWSDVHDAEKPYEYINQLKAWKDAGTILSLHVTDTNISWNVSIEELKYSENDATGDVNYTISFKEYRSVAGRITKKTATTKYTVKSKDTLKKLAYKYLGATKYSSTIYTQNKNAIEKAWTKYRNKKNKEIKAYNRKHSKKKALIKDKTSKKGAHLVKGTKLVIKSGVIT